MTHTPTDAVLTRNQKREEAAIALGRSLTIGWSDIMAYASVYPQHERRALAEIVWLLGYLPQQNIIIPHEVFIRTLIEQRDTGMITEDEFVGGVLTHVTHIRNDDMNKHGWSNICNPTKEEYRRYSNTLTDYKNRVSDKVEKFFGEVPDLVYSLEPEMMLREIMHKYALVNVPELTSFDYRTFTIIAYRKAYLTSGAEAANHSPPIRARR